MSLYIFLRLLLLLLLFNLLPFIAFHFVFLSLCLSQKVLNFANIKCDLSLIYTLFETETNLEHITLEIIIFLELAFLLLFLSFSWQKGPIRVGNHWDFYGWEAFDFLYEYVLHRSIIDNQFEILYLWAYEFVS